VCLLTSGGLISVRRQDADLKVQEHAVRLLLSWNLNADLSHKIRLRRHRPVRSPQFGHIWGGYVVKYSFLGKDFPHCGQPAKSIRLPAEIHRLIRNTEGTTAAAPAKR